MRRSWWLGSWFAGSLWIVGSGRAFAAEGNAPDEFPYEPTSSKAPPSKELEDGEAEPEPEPEPEPIVEAQPEPARPRDRPFARHGFGFRGGITVIPTWILARWVDAHTNALCRGDKLGNFAESRGLLKTEGCNFYVGGEYIYRQSRVLDIVASVGYQRLRTPEGYWLNDFDAAAAQVGGSAVGGADYTEVDIGVLYMEADFIARVPVIVTKDVEFGIGGGAGVGLGVLFGGVYQTAIGSAPDGYTPGVGETADATCQTIRDLADFQRCTPRYDPQEDPDGTPPDVSRFPQPNDPVRPFAGCTSDECSGRDLSAFGYRKKNDSIPPVIPVVNLILSARLIVKDTLGITISGGFNTGFYFGGSLAYFFGKKK